MFQQALLVWAIIINSMHSLKIQLCIFAGHTIFKYPGNRYISKFWQPCGTLIGKLSICHFSDLAC